MATKAEVTPNRRGVKSRELVLDAAERVMAEHGYDGASVARVVEEAGIPLSSVYHYFGSKDGILLAVMERGAERFFAELPLSATRLGSSREHLDAMVSTLIEALGRHPNFLRLLIVFATQPRAAGSGEVREVVSRVRATALQLLRRQLALAYGDDPADPAVEQLARFALAAIDGAFVASQTDEDATLEGTLLPWAASLDALYATLNRRGSGQNSTRPRATPEGAHRVVSGVDRPCGHQAPDRPRLTERQVVLPDPRAAWRRLITDTVQSVTVAPAMTADGRPSRLWDPRRIDIRFLRQLP